MTKLLGPPNGRYFHDENEYWLYDNYLKEDDDGVYFPEFIIKNGKSFQVNWVPTDRLAKSLEITAGFKDFRPPDVIKKKDFFVTDTRGMEVGKTKADVIATLGEPDYKWVFNAKEIWDYLFVPFSKDDGKIYRLYFEFDGDKVTQSYGN
jgi:hypothetical protein